jgi:Delta7-sterol 5-desaturase
MRGPTATGLSPTAWISEKASRLAHITEENAWKNEVVLHYVFQLPQSWLAALPHVLQTWFRNTLATYTMYFGAGLGWLYYAYFVWGDELYKGGEEIPPLVAVLEQMKVSIVAVPGYALLPTVTEYLMERGFTHVYPRLSDVGVPFYVAIFVGYMCCVEFGVYWAHRLLHDLPWGYRHLHSVHHKYNKENTLSPFASLAFHPVDGVAQGMSYCLMLTVFPMHLLTHELLLFFTAIWTTSIHDNVHANVMPIMGAGYHTIHHTTYKHNYGHYTIYFDKLYGSLTTPEDTEGVKKLEELVFEEKAKEMGVRLPSTHGEVKAKKGKRTASSDSVETIIAEEEVAATHKSL